MAATVEGANFTTQVGERQEGAAEHHAHLQLHDLVHRRQPDQRPRTRLGHAGPQRLTSVKSTGYTKTSTTTELVARLLGQVVRPVLQRLRRRGLHGERLLPQHLHDRRGRLRQLPGPLHQRGVPRHAGQLQVEQRLLVLEPARRLQLLPRLQPHRTDGHLQQALQPQLQRAEDVHADAVRGGRPLGAGDHGLGRQRARHGRQRLHQEHPDDGLPGRPQHVSPVPLHQRRDLPA